MSLSCSCTLWGPGTSAGEQRKAVSCGFLLWNPASIFISIWSVSCLVHSNGTSKLPPGRILTDHAKTSGTPDIVSGSSMTVDPLDLIIFLVPSWVQMTPTKFVDVKSVPKMTGHCICLQTMKD